MREKIINYIRAGYPGLYLVSHEEQRVEAELKAVAARLSYHLLFWSVADGWVDSETGAQASTPDPLEALQSIQDGKERGIYLLRDFHLFLADPNPLILRKLKDVLQQAKTACKTVVVLGCRLLLPPELEQELTVVEFELPDKDQLQIVLNGILKSAGINPVENLDAILDAASGMTTLEAENAFALSVVETGRIEPGIVAREQAQVVKKNGLLEIVETNEGLNSVGGLDVLKAWLLKRKNAFSKRAMEYGLPSPKGLLILGIPGTGKSLTAKVTARVFGLPLLKLDAGKLFAGLVGQSEANLRSVTQTAEAIAPCVLWIDEIEKGFAGAKSSGSTDGGTSARVLGSFLSWMQEKKRPVFVVATANDVSQLPPEMLRKGRWDELFFVDLPNQTERESIWEIQIGRYQRDPKDFDTVQVARTTEGLTGSEIESVFVEALHQSFDASKEPSDLAIAQVLTDFAPLSKLMAEPIASLRNWAKGRARAATTQPLHSEQKLRKLAG